LQCPRTFYTDLDTLICKTLPQTDLRCEQHTSWLRDPAIAWHAPHRTDQRQRKQHQLHAWYVAVLLAPTGIDVCDPSPLSYEAKAQGVVRGMRISDIKKVCPDVVLLPSDYETYSLLSKQFFAIVRRFTSEVEEYSIDELFCD
jgi:hypothetical protein